MKSLFFLLTLIPSMLLAQSSWVNVVVQTDNYGSETTWEIYQDTNIVATSPTYDSNSYYETMVNLDAGQYNLVIYDEFGDGICCAYGEGFFGLSNSCVLNTFVYYFAACAFFRVEPVLWALNKLGFSETKI